VFLFSSKLASWSFLLRNSDFWNQKFVFSASKFLMLLGIGISANELERNLFLSANNSLFYKIYLISKNSINSIYQYLQKNWVGVVIFVLYFWIERNYSLNNCLRFQVDQYMYQWPLLIISRLGVKTQKLGNEEQNKSFRTGRRFWNS